MSDKTITIAFPQGGIIPGAVLGQGKDEHVPALKAIDVPERYGQHLIDDRFAVKAEHPEVKSKSKAELKKALRIAEDAVDEARKDVEAAGADMMAKAEAETRLKAAEDALAALKA